jgi:hypothetical protein
LPDTSIAALDLAVAAKYMPKQAGGSAENMPAPGAKPKYGAPIPR